MTVKDRIEEIISNGAKCSYPEYRAIWDDIRKSRKPVNLLVFGTGHDTPLWEECNEKGLTVFIENNPKWVEFGQKQGSTIVSMAYNTRKLAKDQIHDVSKLSMDLPKSVEETEWTHIFVDGPVGRTQGRMKSIYNASRLAGPETIVYVHDYNRKSEQLYTDHFLEVEKVVHRLAVCRSRT